MLRELGSILGPDATTANLTTAAIIAWKARFGPLRAPQTIIGQLSNLRTIAAIAIEEGWLDRAPTFARLRPKVPPPGRDDDGYWTFAEASSLLTYLRARVVHLGDWRSRRLYAAAAVSLYTGLRRDELLFLRLEDLDLEAGLIWVVRHRDRGLKTAQAARVVPIAPELRAILAEWLPFAGPVYVLPGIKRRSAWHGGKPGCRPADDLRAACVAAKVPAGTWQWARRTWATHAELAWSLSDPAIERVLGHAPGRTPGATSKRWYRKRDLAGIIAIGQRVTYQS